MADRPGHDQRYAIDCSKIASELGFEPSETFASGLRKTVMWYLANRAWWERIRSGVYRGERLGVVAGVRHGRVDAEGRFRFDGLVPGSYRVALAPNRVRPEDAEQRLFVFTEVTGVAAGRDDVVLRPKLAS